MTYSGHKVLINSGYFVIYYPEHHLAVSGGIVYLHRLIAEEKLKRTLMPNETVHHIDFNRFNNDPENLMIFKTNSDHILFHKGYECELQGDVYVAKLDTKPVSRRLKECPSCGKLINIRSNLCKQCHNETKRSHNVTPKELKYLTELYSYTTIGKMLGVSANAVKKACIRNGFQKKCYPDPPSKDALESDLKNKTPNEIAKKYGVARDTVLRWAKKYNIQIKSKHAVVCVETNIEYENCRDAGEYVYPEVARKTAANAILKVLNTDNSYKNYHWKTVSN